MAARLHGTPRLAVYEPGKPEFPTQLLLQAQVRDITLLDFIGDRSWLLFELTGLASDWLTLPPEEWEQNPAYREMADVVKNMAVVNDAAERGVRDVQDYANSAGDGEHRGEIVLVSNSHRIKLPKFLKNELEEQL